MVSIFDTLKDDNIECILSCLSDITTNPEKLKIIYRNYTDLLKIFDNIYKYKLVCTLFHKFYDNDYVKRLKKRINYYYLRNFNTSMLSHHSLFDDYKGLVLDLMLRFIPDKEMLGRCSSTFGCFAISSHNLVVIEPTCRKSHKAEDSEYIINIYSIHDETYDVIKRVGFIIRTDRTSIHSLQEHELPDIFPNNVNIKIYKIGEKLTWICII